MSVTGSSSQSGDTTPIDPCVTGDPVALLRACHDRRLEREGIPMVLGLADERGEIPVSTSAEQRGEGAALAEQRDRYVAALVPWARENDESAIITATQVLAFTHFDPGAAGAVRTEPSR